MKSTAITKATTALFVIIIILAAGLGYEVLSPAATAPGAATTVTQTLTPSQSQIQSLADLAKAQGGTMTLYTILDQNFDQFFLPAFLKIYPWAHITKVPLDPSTLITRPVSEFKAGKVTADLIQATNDSISADVAAGACQKVNLTAYLQEMGYPQAATDPRGYWFPQWESPGVIFYNTNLVQPSQVPKSYADLANPAFKGEMAIPDPSVQGSVTSIIFTNLYATMGNSSWNSLMKGIAANNPSLEVSGSTVDTLVSSGQAAIGIDTISSVFLLQNATNPIKIAYTTPLYTPISTICMATNDPHPAMAMLYLEWALSPAGMNVIGQSNHVPALPAAYPSAFGGKLPSNVTLSPGVPASTHYSSNFTQWQAIYKSIFG